MIGLDTNVLIRYFAQDDPVQAQAARTLIERTLTRESPGHVAAISLAEFAWVLKRLYRGSRSEIGAAIEGLLTSPTLVIEHKALAWKALAGFLAGKSGFGDYLIAQINRAAGCSVTVTFDREAASDPGFQLLK